MATVGTTRSSGFRSGRRRASGDPPVRPAGAAPALAGTGEGGPRSSAAPPSPAFERPRLRLERLCARVRSASATPRARFCRARRVIVVEGNDEGLRLSSVGGQRGIFGGRGLPGSSSSLVCLPESPPPRGRRRRIEPRRGARVERGARRGPGRRRRRPGRRSAGPGGSVGRVPEFQPSSASSSRISPAGRGSRAIPSAPAQRFGVSPTSRRRASARPLLSAAPRRRDGQNPRRSPISGRRAARARPARPGPRSAAARARASSAAGRSASARSARGGAGCAARASPRRTAAGEAAGSARSRATARALVDVPGEGREPRDGDGAGARDANARVDVHGSVQDDGEAGSDAIERTPRLSDSWRC